MAVNAHPMRTGGRMSLDIDAVLRGWKHKEDVVQARMVRAGDGRQVIQIRVELGVLQLELTGRPDGQRPHGHTTYFDYLQAQARAAARRGEGFTLNEDQCRQADREFVQFYHRRVGWLALRQYDKALADAEHTLAFMDFVRDHSPNDEFTQSHEQYRPFVIFHRTQAAAARQAEQDRPDAAIDELRAGLERIRAFYHDHGRDDEFDEDHLVQTLRKMEDSMRQLHGIQSTLQEQLDEAIAAENYEAAARLRDQLRKRQ
jgi:hypothetical protein